MLIAPNLMALLGTVSSGTDITCIRLVSLNVPARVKKGSSVQLSCLYDLGNASLYSLKWFYRNHKNPEEQEFF
ncbi:unnamed protein product, partial [Oppiella nova]